MCLGTCLRTSKVFKFSFIPFNVLIMCLCVGVVVLSSMKLHIVSSYSQLTGGYGLQESHISIWFVVLSVMELLMAGLGTVVAMRQTSNFVAGYFILGVPVACALMSLAMFQLAGEFKMTNDTAEAMLYYMDFYKNYSHVRKDIDHGQREKECCGANDFRDWLSLPGNFSNTNVPKTCCLPHALFQNPLECNLDVIEQAGSETLRNNIYVRGCIISYTDELGSLPKNTGIIMTAIAVMQFGALITIVLVYGRQFSESIKHVRNRIV